jgi:hypothetical protein
MESQTLLASDGEFLNTLAFCSSQSERRVNMMRELAVLASFLESIAAVADHNSRM